MKISRISQFKAGSATLILGVALASTPVFAQTTTPENTNASATDETGTIVVTGSRISRPDLDSPLPLTVMSGEEIFETGQVSVGDMLNNLPQLRSTFSQANSTRFLGTRGLNLLDLRGLGSERTLVLVNGRRHVASDVLSTGVSVDVNTIPSDLVERADIVTGGNSAVYGSDAIAGVVNFVLKNDFEGIRVRGQAGLNPRYMDAGNQFVSVTAGTNFAEGRGNIVVSAEYAHQSRYFASGRGSNVNQSNGFVVVDQDAASAVNGSDGIPDRVFMRDIRSTTISTGGLAPVYMGSATTCGRDTVGNNFACTYLFQPDGTLTPQTGLRVGLGPNGSFIGGNGYSGREGQLLALSPQLDRYSINAMGHYEVSPAFVPFFEAKYVRSEAFGSQSGPFFAQGTTLGDPFNRERVSLSNPYLSAQARNMLVPQMLASTVNVNTGNAFTDIKDANGVVTSTAAQQLAAQRAAITAGTFRFNLRRNWVDLGIRDEEIRRETYRGVFGIRGDFNDDWKYEVSVNYGEHHERNRIQGNVNTQRFLLAMDTATDSTGRIVCASQINPARRLGYIDNGAQLDRDIAACVPLNPFGDGSVTQAARDYLIMPTTATGVIRQFVASGFVAGDTSQWFELPGGPVGFSIGAEYRRETIRYELDEMTQAGYAFYNAIPSLFAPAFEVKELFGELRVPLLADRPFFQQLTLTAAGRFADYKGETGSVFAYSGSLEWSPIRDLTLRGSYSRSIRAPNLSELYSAQGQNFAPAPADPCSERNLATGSSYRAANCATAGRPAGYDYVYTSSIEIVSGGNPELREETSTSWTVGGQLTPRFLPGFSLQVDYYDIKVKDVISAVSAQQIMNLCYDSPTLDNPFCPLFQRAGANGGPAGEVPFQILQGSLLQSTLNFASLRARGIDTNVNYIRNFDWGRVNVGLIWTRVLERSNFTDPSRPTYENQILQELGDPKNQINLSASVNVGRVTLGYQMRWIDRMYLNTYEDYNSINGLPPQNTDYAEVKYYPDVTYHDIRLGVDVNDNFNLYVGVDNVFDRVPPYGLTGVTDGSGIYDARGRYGYVGVRANF